MEVKILNAEEVRQRLEQMRRDLERATDTDIVVGSNLAYAPGIEYGRHPGGRVARKAGGAFALTDAFKAVRPNIAPAMAQALERGIDVSTVLWKAGYDVEAFTKAYLGERVYAQPIPTTRKGKPKWQRMGTLKNSFQAKTARDFRALYRS